MAARELRCCLDVSWVDTATEHTQDLSRGFLRITFSEHHSVGFTLSERDVDGVTDSHFHTGGHEIAQRA
jgi:hypothetical protein